MGNNDYRVVTWKALNSFITENGGTPLRITGATSLALRKDEFPSYAPMYNGTTAGIVINDYTGVGGGAYANNQLVIEKDVTWRAADAPVVINPTSITVTPNKTLHPNETQQLIATVEPLDTTDKSVTWSSEDESIATVDSNGLVTAVAVGKVKIYAISVADPTINGYATITVTQAPLNDPLGIIVGVDEHITPYVYNRTLNDWVEFYDPDERTSPYTMLPYDTHFTDIRHDSVDEIMIKFEVADGYELSYVGVYPPEEHPTWTDNIYPDGTDTQSNFFNATFDGSVLTLTDYNWAGGIQLSFYARSVEKNDEPGEIIVPPGAEVIENFKTILITYRFNNGSDLDTATYVSSTNSTNGTYYGYLGDKSSEYVSFSGDDISVGNGVESVLIRKDNLINNQYQSDDEFYVNMFVNWFGFDVNDSTTEHPAYPKIQTNNNSTYGSCDITVTAYDEDEFTLSNGVYIPAGGDSTIVKTFNKTQQVIAGGVLNYQNVPSYYAKSWVLHYYRDHDAIVMMQEVTHGIYPVLWISGENTHWGFLITPDKQDDRNWAIDDVNSERATFTLHSLTKDYSSVTNGNAAETPRSVTFTPGYQLLSDLLKFGITDVNIYQGDTLIGTINESNQSVQITPTSVNETISVEIPGISLAQTEFGSFSSYIRIQQDDSPEYILLTVRFKTKKLSDYYINVIQLYSSIPNYNERSGDVDVTSYSGDSGVETTLVSLPSFVTSASFGGTPLNVGGTFTTSGTLSEKLDLTFTENNEYWMRSGTIEVSNAGSSDDTYVNQFGRVHLSVSMSGDEMLDKTTFENNGVLNQESEVSQSSYNYYYGAGIEELNAIMNLSITLDGQPAEATYEIIPYSGSLSVTNGPSAGVYNIHGDRMTEGETSSFTIKVMSADGSVVYGYKRIIISRDNKA